MANQDYFALLLAGLDAQQSAAEINQQLNSPEFKQALEQIKIDFKLDENAFAGLIDAMKNGFTFASKIKDELEMAQGYFLSMQKPAVTKTPGFSYEEDLMFKEAQKIAPGMDISVVSKSIDAITGATTKMKFAYKDAEDAVSSFSITLDDSTGAYEFIPSVIKTTSAMSVKLKEAEQDFKKLNTTYKNLKAEEFKFGPTPETTAQLAKVEDETNAIYQNLQTIARQSNFLPPEQIAPTLAIIEKMLNRTTELRAEYAKSLDISSEQKAGISALKDYKKLVDEISVLEAKQSVQGADFSMVDKLALNRLKEQKILLEETFAPFSQLTEKAREYDKLIAGQQKWDIAEEEIKRGVTLTSQLSKEYEKLNKNTLEIGKAGLKKSTEANIPALEQERAVLLKNIAAYEDQIRLLNQSPEGLQNAQKLLSQAQQIAQDELTKTNNLLIAQQKIKEEAQSAFMGTQGGGTTAVDFSTMSEKISLTNTHLNKFAQELYGINAAVKSATTVTDDYGRELVELEIVQDKNADTLDIVKVRLDAVSQSYGVLDNYTQKNISRSMAFTQQIGHAIKKMATWGVAARLLYGSTRQLQQGFEFIKDLDKDITQAAIVTGQQRSQVQYLTQDYANLALAMGKTVKEISQVNTELLRQGLTIQESAARLDTIIKLSAAGQISTEESLHVVTAAVNAMQESHIKAADVMLRASNISASSVEQLGEAFTKTASSAHATGMSIEETTGILATMLEVTQEGPSQLGTSLKTILARFTRVNEETGEFNEELNDVQSAIESVGIRFLDADGQIRSVYAILEDLSEVWPTLTKNQQAYIATTAAGVRMQNRFFAVMENFDRVKTITEESGKAAGTTNQAYLTYLDSVEAASNRTKAAMEQLWINTINSDDIKMLYDLGTGIIRLVDNIGVLELATMALVGAFVKQTGMLKVLIDHYASTGVAALTFSQIMDVAAYASASAKMDFTGLKGTLVGLGRAASDAGGELLTKFGPQLKAGLVIGGISIALMVLVKAFQSYRKAQEEARKKLVEINNAFLDHKQNLTLNQTALKDMGVEYQSYVNKIKTSGLSAETALTADEYERFTSLQSEITAILPNAATQLDAYGNTMLDFGAAAGSATEQYEKFIEKVNQDYYYNADALIAQTSKDIDDLTKRIKDNQKELAGEGQGSVPILSESRKKQLEEEIDLLRQQEKMMQSTAIAQWIQKMEAGIAIGAEGAIKLNHVQKTLLMLPETAYAALGKTGDELEAFLTQVSGNDAFNSLDTTFTKQSEAIDALNQQYKDGTLTQVAYNKEFAKLVDMDINQLISGLALTEDEIAQLEKILPVFTLLLNDSKIVMTEEEIAAENLAEALERAKTATEFYSDVLDEYADSQKLSQKTKFAIIDQYPELIKYMGDEKVLIEQIKEAQLEQDRLIEESYLNKIRMQLENDKVFYDTKRKDIMDLAKDLAKIDKKQLAAAKTVAEARKAIEAGLLSDMSGMWGEYYRALTSGDEAKLAALEARLEKQANFQTEIKKLGPYIEAMHKLDNIIKTTLKDSSEITRIGGGSKDTLAQADAYQKYTIALEDNSNALVRNQSLQEQEDLALEERLKLMQEEIDLNNERQELLHQLNQARRAERDTLAISLMKQGFKIIGEGDKQRIENLEHIQGKSEKIEEQFKRFIELQTSLIPEASDEWWQLENAIAGTTKSMQELIAEAKDAEIARRIEEANKAYEEQQDRLRALEDVQSKLVEFIRKRGEAEREELEKTQKLEMDALEKTYNARKQAYEDDLDEFEKLINGRIKALQDESAAEDYAKNLQSKRDEANELQRQIDILALDTSLTAQKKVIELREQQAAINEEIATMQQDKERELIIDSLEAQLNEYQLQTENKINLIDEEYKAEKTALEKIQDIEKGILEERYTDAKIYSEARQALIDGEVRTYEGYMISIKDALREMAEESGEIFGILGNTIEEELIQKLEDAQRAIEEITSGNLLSKPDEEAIAEEVEQEFARPPEFRDLTDAEWRRYLRNKRRWEEAFEEGRDKNTDPDMLGWAAENIKIRKDYGINSDRYSYEDLVNWSGYADGGKNIRPGLAMLHGTQNDPEWIFNDDQFQETLKRSIGAALHFSLPNIDSNYTKDEIEVKIGTLVNIEGNADRTAIPLIKNASAELAERLKIELAKIGVERAAF